MVDDKINLDTQNFEVFYANEAQDLFKRRKLMLGLLGCKLIDFIY